jgi:hypothetical protein
MEIGLSEAQSSCPVINDTSSYTAPDKKTNKNLYKRLIKNKPD